MKRSRNFVDEYLEYGKAYITSPNYLRWAAHWMLGTAVTRSVSLKATGTTYPNLYIMLTGMPGAGKSQAVLSVRRVMGRANRDLPKDEQFKFSPDSVTRASVEDYMKDNLVTRKDSRGNIEPRNEFVVAADEIYGILPEHDLGHLTLYNDLFDNKTSYVATTRTHGEVNLMAPYCSILCGVQPGFLVESMPEGAWSMGFMSRSILVYGRNAERRSLLEANQPDEILEKSLGQWIAKLARVTGHFVWTDEAKATIDSWWLDAGAAPVPTEPRLVAGYNQRRGFHLIKLAMTHSLAESTDLVITGKHVIDALMMMHDTEAQMKNIFVEMRTAGKATGFQAIIDQLRIQYSTTQEPILESQLTRMFLSAGMHPGSIQSMIDQSVSSGILKLAPGSRSIRGSRSLIPTATH